MKNIAMISAFITVALTACGTPAMTAPANTAQQSTDHQTLCNSAGRLSIIWDQNGMPGIAVGDTDNYYIGGKYIKFTNNTTVAVQFADGSIVNLGKTDDIPEKGVSLPKSIFTKYNGDVKVRVIFKPETEQMVIVSGPPNLETSIGMFSISDYYCN